ncbi:MAG: hypothetical protein Q9167_006644 [Letrouitia subvulpina]
MAFRPQRFSLPPSKSSLVFDTADFMPGSQRHSIASHTPFALSSPFAPFAPQTLTIQPPQYSTAETQRRSRSNKPPSPVFQRLPSEIYHCILQQLEVFHNEPSSMSCQTCYLRDLCALALTSRAWDRAVRSKLYSRIFVVGHDSPVHLKRFKMKSGVRLKLLRRTLRERRVLAQYVRELKAPRLQPSNELINEHTRNLIASVVMCCPNLEKLVGVYPAYGHEFDRLTYALSTRTKLKERVWFVGENQTITQRSQKQLPPGLMDNAQVHDFLHMHNKWESLTTLFLFSGKHGILERDALIQTLYRLPSLQHLCISNFDMDDFDDVTLQSLPPLQSLRLQELEGVTFWGLSEFSRTKSARAIQSISLVHLDITYLSAVSNLFLYLSELKRFTLVQDSCPEVATGELIFQPIIASQSLEYLHWDIMLPGTANENLAKSILAGGFPNLRTLRAPFDYDGVLQMLCRPKAQAAFPSDKYNKFYHADECASGGGYTRALLAARKAAQQRIEDARNSVLFKVVVEEDGRVQEIFDLCGYIGTIGSKIRYSLEPDVPGNDRALIDFSDLFGGAEEMAPKGGCTGMWNASHHAGKKWWHHAERHRFRPVDLHKFF